MAKLSLIDGNISRLVLGAITKPIHAAFEWLLLKLIQVESITENLEISFVLGEMKLSFKNFLGSFWQNRHLIYFFAKGILIICDFINF